VSVIQTGDLYLSNAYASIWALTRYDTVTGQYVPLTGATCTVQIKDGPSHQTAVLPLPETSVPGTYATTITAAVIDAAFGHGPNHVTEIVTIGSSAVFSRLLDVHTTRYVP
jgi:hypothetical protein